LKGEKMASRASLNKVMLIGNLTRDPELRYTPQGSAVCTFGLATNRIYVSSDGQKREEAQFHRIVAWNKLAELCSQLLVKGRKVYVEGRLQTRTWQTPTGEQRQITEIVIDDMRILDSKRPLEEVEIPEEIEAVEERVVAEVPTPTSPSDQSQIGEEKKPEEQAASPKERKKKKEEKSQESEEEILEDLPF
jgi:single-strand DNA-binding protein